MAKKKNFFEEKNDINNFKKSKRKLKKNLENQIKEELDLFINPELSSPKNGSEKDDFKLNEEIKLNKILSFNKSNDENKTNSNLIKENIRKNKSINILEEILNDIKVLDNSNEEDLKNSIALVKTVSFNKLTPNKKQTKKYKKNSLHPEMITNELNIKFDDIKDLNKKIEDIGDYNLIQTPFKIIGEELLNDEINIKYKSKLKGNPENNQIIKKLKDNFKKLVYYDKKDKPNLSKIILDQEMSDDVKIKILRKLIRFTTEDEVFSEDAEKIKLEINNLIKLKKIKSTNDYDELWKQIEEKEIPTDLKNKLEDMYYRVITGDQSKLMNFINNVLRLPYHKIPNILDKISCISTPYHEQIEFIKSLYKTLDENLYGLNDVKDSIISFICQKINNPGNNSSKYLCLYGPAGVGKTSIVHAISEALKIPYSYLSLANIDETSSLIGHSFTYEGSIYGCIADSLIKNGCTNGILLFDEIDKCKEKIQNTLLGIFDPLQNYKFRDSYYGNFYVDLSKSMMIICLNELDKINPILKDRLHIVNIPGYNENDKKIIIKKYILPKLENQYKLNINIDKDVIDKIIDYSKDYKGIRQIIMNFTKIYELMILDKYTQKFNFNNKFTFKDIKNLNLENIDKSYLHLYT